MLFSNSDLIPQLYISTLLSETEVLYIYALGNKDYFPVVTDNNLYFLYLHVENCLPSIFYIIYGSSAESSLTPSFDYNLAFS